MTSCAYNSITGKGGIHFIFISKAASKKTWNEVVAEPDARWRTGSHPPIHFLTRAMACIFMPFAQLRVIDVISDALTPAGPPICTTIICQPCIHLPVQDVWTLRMLQVSQ